MSAVVALGAGTAVATAGVSEAAKVGCRVQYRTTGTWVGGHTAKVKVRNLGDSLSSWTLSWTAPGGRTVSQPSGAATLTQVGSRVTAGGTGATVALSRKQAVTFTFASTGSPVIPSSFTLNGIPCTGEVSDTGPTATTPVPPTPTTPVPTTPVPTTPVPTTPVPTTTPAPTTTRPTEPGGGAQQGIPAAYQVRDGARPNTVRVFWLKPSDVPFDTAHPEGMAKVMHEVQRFYREQFGKTFSLNEDQVVEVLPGDHPKVWYETTPNGSDQYFWAVFNMDQEIRRKLANQNLNQWMTVEYVSAEGDGGGGGGGNGGVILNQHDADGAAGLVGTADRWYGGMAHELGHAFGLPDASYDDQTCMSNALYAYPNCFFTPAQKQQVLNGPWARFLS